MYLINKWKCYRKNPGVQILLFGQNMLKVKVFNLERRSKEEFKKFEKKMLRENKEEIRNFMKDEYRNTSHYKRKTEEFKVNKLMGRVKANVKGPNPLSIRKRAIDDMNEVNKDIVDEQDKAKRKRKKKNIN
jgi:hypothetical protein